MSFADRRSYLKNLDVPAFLERPDVAAFVGKNFDHYKTIWLKDYAKKGSAAKMVTGWHWQWMAFGFWPAWYGYRRLWPMIGGLLLAFALVTFGQAYFENIRCMKLGDGAGTGVLLFLAINAKNFYFMHVVDFFRKAEMEKGPALQEKMRQQGATSVADGILASVLFVGVVFGAVYAGEMVFPLRDACVDKDVSVIAGKLEQRMENLKQLEHIKR